MTTASKKQKQIIHPIFSECAGYTLDPYWQQILNECATGKFPRGVSLRADGKVMYIMDGGSVPKTVIISKYSPEELFPLLKDLFSECLGFRSNKDNRHDAKEIAKMEQSLRETYSSDWKTISRRKNDTLIHNFVLNLKEEHDLSESETKKLLSIIKLGFSFNSIKTVDVDYQDGQIISISSLLFDEDTRTFSIKSPSASAKRRVESPKMSLSAAWNKKNK